jgi:hypothetical protein
MRAKILAGIATVAAIVGSGVLIPVVAANAATCDVEIGVTAKSGNYITGYGSLSQGCTGSTATIVIQKYVGLGYWADEAPATVNGPGYDQHVSYYCVGTGTQTWHTRIYGYTLGGNLVQKDSNSIRVTC